MTPDHANASLVKRFYDAFAELDHVTMGACYADDATFSDPVFRDLDAPAVRAMWRMLCTRATDLELTISDVRASDSAGAAHWDASYTFATGRKVLNRIDASFTIRDGSFTSHTDVFDLWAWTRMALGPPGWLLGWSPPLQRKVRSQAMGQLDRFMAKEG
jgi:ketosteroid isomerase-like protein